MTPEEESERRERMRQRLNDRKQTSLILYDLNRANYDRQRKELQQAEDQAEGKFRRRRRLPRKEATGNPPTTLL